MKLSDFNITEGLHTRWCRFMIQRYLGQFLEQNLTLDQLSVKLIDGELTINEVNINAHVVLVPFEFLPTILNKVSIEEVPWRALTSDASKMKVRQLDLTFESRDGVIDAIVSRFCLELVDTTIRLENPPKLLSDMCTAIEFRVRFMDEQMRNCQQEGRSAETITSQPQGMGSIANLNKFMDMSGIGLRFIQDQYSDNNSSQISDPSKKESTLLSAKIGTVLVYIPHNDAMSVEYVKTLSNGCHEAVDYILKESEALVVYRYLFNRNLLVSNQAFSGFSRKLWRGCKYFIPVWYCFYKFLFVLLQSKAYVYVGKCRCELDLSIVDRIADLFEPRPFFDLPSYRKEPLQLRDDLFSIPLVLEQPSKLMVVLKCQAIDLNLRIPIADLRNPNGARLPYRQRHVHPEYIGLHISSVTVEIPIGGESTLVELFATEIYGSFCGESEKFTCSDEDRHFVWGGQTSVDDGISDEMTKSISLSVMQSLPQREGPFAQTHRSYLHNHEEGNDLILAGSREEMTAFGAKCILQSILVISLDIPILRFLIPSHSYLEVLYNRLVNDLLLWQPAAPSVRPGDDDYSSNWSTIFRMRSAIMHSPIPDEDDCEEERFTSSQANGYDKNKSHTLCLLLNVKKGMMLMCTGAENADQGEKGQISIELSDAQLFTVAGYHGRISDTYFYFTTHTVGVGHRMVNQADFGKWSRDDTQMDTIPSTDEFSSQCTDDSVGVAIYLCERLGQNIKDVLLAIAVRSTCVQLRPFRSSKETWMYQLAELFALQDYPIPGYELPVVTTDLHIHLDNVVLAYDHSWICPDSDIRLRLVLGESDISSSIIQDMNAAKVGSEYIRKCSTLHE
ncbi:unnamed protein product [Haemonchus placei]|uniref:Autophagy-related protein 2 n=1 Tax=Haemonchus placei TaxID=6290 RepID=A0A158QP49_HAEPC|nr:unnamed protein product [Haemonchus placei]